MKRLITFICLIVVVVLGYFWISNGFEMSFINIASYDKMKTKSEALTKKLASYDKKNQEEYETAISSLNSTIKMYKNSKSKYTEIYEELADVLKSGETETKPEEIIDEVIYSDKEKYNVDFLYVTLGNYAGKEGVDMTYKLTTSSTTDPNSTTLKYFLADLEFAISGEYINITNFISDLENDDKLNWEINNFEMTSGKASFVVKDVPIDSESYIESKAPTTSGSEDQNGQVGTSDPFAGGDDEMMSSDVESQNMESSGSLSNSGGSSTDTSSSNSNTIN